MNYKIIIILILTFAISSSSYSMTHDEKVAICASTSTLFVLVMFKYLEGVPKEELYGNPLKYRYFNNVIDYSYEAAEAWKVTKPFQIEQAASFVVDTCKKFR